MNLKQSKPSHRAKRALRQLVLGVASATHPARGGALRANRNRDGWKTRGEKLGKSGEKPYNVVYKPH